MQIKKLLRYFSPFEWGLFLGSVLLILISFLWSGEFYPLTLIASLLGVTALAFISKGHVLGQFLSVIFCILYAVISIRFHYWGEMLTYLLMALPAAVCACISWLKHPAKQGVKEVEVATLSRKGWVLCSSLSLLVTLVFFFVLRYFNTPNLLLSTLSVTTSFLAAALLILRSRFYAIAYASNDLILVGLWILASVSNPSYLPMVLCFLSFLVNDLYGFFNWERIRKRQNQK